LKKGNNSLAASIPTPPGGSLKGGGKFYKLNGKASLYKLYPINGFYRCYPRIRELVAKDIEHIFYLG
jgi:hypothetical protein